MSALLPGLFTDSQINDLFNDTTPKGDPSDYTGFGGLGYIRDTLQKGMYNPDNHDDNMDNPLIGDESNKRVIWNDFRDRVAMNVIKKLKLNPDPGNDPISGKIYSLVQLKLQLYRDQWAFVTFGPSDEKKKGLQLDVDAEKSFLESIKADESIFLDSRAIPIDNVTFYSIAKRKANLRFYEPATAAAVVAAMEYVLSYLPSNTGKKFNLPLIGEVPVFIGSPLVTAMAIFISNNLQQYVGIYFDWADYFGDGYVGPIDSSSSTATFNGKQVIPDPTWKEQIYVGKIATDIGYKAAVPAYSGLINVMLNILSDNKGGLNPLIYGFGAHYLSRNFIMPTFFDETEVFDISGGVLPKPGS